MRIGTISFSDFTRAGFIGRHQNTRNRWAPGAVALLLCALACSTPGASGGGKSGGEIVVRNAAELLSNIGSNRVLMLRGGDYVLPQAAPGGHAHVRASKVFDGFEIVVAGVTNLTIKGAPGSRPRLLARPRYANVLRFENARGVRIENLVAGHSPDPGSCVGGVFLFDSASDIRLRQVDLFGSGTEGLTLENVQDLRLEDSRIRECTYGIMTIRDSRDIVFVNSRFTGNKEYDLINITGSRNVLFDRVRITDNRTGLQSFSNYALFRLRHSTEVRLRDSMLRDNTALYFQVHEGSPLERSGSDLEANRFQRGIDLRIK